MLVYAFKRVVPTKTCIWMVWMKAKHLISKGWRAYVRLSFLIFERCCFYSIKRFSCMRKHLLLKGISWSKGCFRPFRSFRKVVIFLVFGCASLRFLRIVLLELLSFVLLCLLLNQVSTRSKWYLVATFLKQAPKSFAIHYHFFYKNARNQTLLLLFTKFNEKWWNKSRTLIFVVQY